MRPAHRWLAALLLGAAASVQAETTTILKPDEARLTAAQLQSVGQAKAAAQITTVLLQRDPEDAAALIIHSHALRSLGQFDQAQVAGRRAWRAAETDVERFGASLAMAQALSSDGKKTRAQFWLRRAGHVAPNQRLKARAARDFAYLRKTNPWSVHTTFGIVPTDNVNNAPRDNTIATVWGTFIDPLAVPVSGVEVRASLRLRYNFAETATKRNFIGLNWSESSAVFSDDDVPVGLNESDFAYRRVAATLGRDFTSGPKKPRQTISLTFGRTWFGGDPLADELRVDWRQNFIRPEGRRFGWDASLGYADRKDNAIRSGVTASLGAHWSRPFKNGGRLGWHTGVGRTDTDSPALTHTRASLGVQYTHGEPILGAIAQIGLHTEFRDYDARNDTRATLSSSLLFVDFDTYGFAPKLTLEASKTDSTITRYETQSLGLQIGFQSVF